MSFASIDKIELWDIHEPMPLCALTINISHGKPTLPDDVEARVRENWRRFCEERPKAADNDAAYLVSHSRTDKSVDTEVFLAGFSYNQWFNRDDVKMIDAEVANTIGYNPFASWIIAICDNGRYALFGNKKDFGSKKVSGFGGFTSKDDVVGEKVDPEIFTRRKLEVEMGAAYERVMETSVIGLNFYPTVGPKGFDGVYVVKLNGTKEQVAQQFGESSQFSKQLIPVTANPRDLLRFLEASEWEATRSCVAGVFTYIGSRFGIDELEKTIEDYSHKELVTVFGEPINGEVRERILRGD